MIQPVALIVGAGPGISGAFAAALAAEGYRVAVAARDLAKLQPLAASLGATAFEVDASEPARIAALFEQVEHRLGAPEVVLYNPSARIRGDLLSLDIEAAATAIRITAIGALATAQEAARRMLPRRARHDLLHGRHRRRQGLRPVVGVRDGQVRAARPGAEPGARARAVGHPRRPFRHRRSVAAAGGPADAFTPEAIARSYMAALAQPAGAWSWEIELRSHREPF